LLVAETPAAITLRMAQGIDMVTGVDRVDFIFRHHDMQQNNFGRLVANAGEVRADHVSFTGEDVTGGAVLLENGQAVLESGASDNTDFVSSYAFMRLPGTISLNSAVARWRMDSSLCFIN